MVWTRAPRGPADVTSRARGRGRGAGARARWRAGARAAQGVRRRSGRRWELVQSALRPPPLQGRTSTSVVWTVKQKRTCEREASLSVDNYGRYAERRSPQGSRRRAYDGRAHPARRWRARCLAVVRWSPWVRKLARAGGTLPFRKLSRSRMVSIDWFFCKILYLVR